MENTSGNDSLFEIGSLISNRYEVVGRLGAGAMGAVLKVVDRSLDNDVSAIKLLYPHLVKDQIVFARFRNEVLVARQLSHPNIVRVYDFGSAGKGYFFISMEYVRGTSLRERIYTRKLERLKFPEILRILYEAAQGLAHAHRRNVVHRDIKPDNILLSDIGEVKLTDFGLARLVNVDRGFTQTGETVGTPSYMSPEQFKGNDVDGRADIYSLGIIAYEMVSGERPFMDETYLDIATKHLTQDLPPFEKSLEVPSWFQEMVFIATAKDPLQRYETADDLCDVIAHNVDRAERKKLTPMVFTNFAAKQVRVKRSRQKRGRTKKLLVSLLICATALAIPPLLVRTNSGLKQKVLSGIVAAERFSNVELAPVKGLFDVDIAPDVNRLVNEVTSGRSPGLMLAAGVSADSRDASGAPVLVLAAQAKNPQILAALISGGASINLGDTNGMTPLMAASQNDDLESIRLLLSSGADVDSRDKDGVTAVMYAARNGKLAAVKVLREKGALLNGEDSSGTPVLIHAVYGKNALVVQELLERGVSVNDSDGSGFTALMHAVKAGDEEMIRTLLRAGARTDVTSKLGKTAFDIAGQRERKLLAEWSSAPQKEIKPVETQAPSYANELTRLRVVGQVERQFDATRSRYVLSVTVRNVGEVEATNIRVFIPEKGVFSGPSSLGPNKVGTYKRDGDETVNKVAVDCDNCRRE